MRVSYRLRKFQAARNTETQPRMIWCKWFRSQSQAQEFAIADSCTKIEWKGKAVVTENHMYDIKEFNIVV